MAHFVPCTEDKRVASGVFSLIYALDCRGGGTDLTRWYVAKRWIASNNRLRCARDRRVAKGLESDVESLLVVHLKCMLICLRVRCWLVWPAAEQRSMSSRTASIRTM